MVGDIMLDHYWSGQVVRISHEILTIIKFK